MSNPSYPSPGIEELTFKVEIEEFYLVPESELATWWVESHLPNPGCPQSFRIMVNLILATHRVPVHMLHRRANAIKELIGNIRILDEGPYFPYKDKWIPIGQSSDKHYWGDYQLLRIITEGKV